MKIEKNNIYNIDCLEGMRHIADGSISLVLTDPPYGINFGRNEGLYGRSKEGVLNDYIDIPAEEYQEFSKRWISECYRVLKEDGTLYIVSGDENLVHILTALRESNFVKLNHIAWSYQFGVWNESRWITNYNIILCYIKNPKKYKFNTYCRHSIDDKLTNGNSANYKDRETSWYITKERWQDVVTTKTKLPYELIEKIILYSSDPGDTVLDPFLGSGQTAVVSNDLDRQYIGMEKSEEYYEFASYRMKTGKYKISLDEWKNKTVA
jgi:site-specific DNA-methyltransferase (adenine-specific)